MWNEIHSAGEKFYFEFKKYQATGLDVMWDFTMYNIIFFIILKVIFLNSKLKRDNSGMNFTAFCGFNLHLIPS
jgi:RNAse (barnase) inhibitor barstar